MKAYKKVVLILMVLICVQVSINLPTNSTLATAEEGTEISKAVDGLMVPDSPAFAILGVTPQIVTRPGTPRELALSILNGLDANGNPQQGLALDTAPYLLFFGNDITLKNYRDSKTIQRLSGIQLSLATAKGTGDNDKAFRIGTGLRWSSSEGDPRLDQLLIDCIDAAQKSAEKAYPPKTAIETEEETQTRAAQIVTFVESKAKNCRADSSKRNWNRSGADIGIAPSWIDRNSANDTYEWDGLGIWTSLAYGFERFNSLRDNSQLILHARYRTKEEIQDANSSTGFHKQDSYSLGLKFRYGGPRQTLLLQSVYIQTKPEGQPKDSSYRYSLGGELALSDNLWLDVEVGGTAGRNDQNNDKFVTTQFKWALAEQKASK